MMSPEHTPEDSPEQTSTEASLRNTREAAREKAQQLQTRQSRARLLRRIVLGAVTLLVIAAVAVGVILAVGSTVSKPLLNPRGMSDDGVEVQALSATAEDDATLAATDGGEGEGAAESEEPVVPENAAPVDIHIFVDYLSPGAGDFQRANAEQLEGWITDGAVSVSYHPVALLTANSNGTRYSLRAAGAAACVATHASEEFTAFNHALLVDQPEVDSSGLSNDELIEIARASGVRPIDTVRDCIVDQDFIPWAKEATSRALAGPLPGSDDLVLSSAPTVVVNGQAYIGALDNPAEFSQFVLTVASEAYYSAPPTPSPAP